ncbi:FlgD immunoglobulin-like domain containing protein, partial [bacterium]
WADYNGDGDWLDFGERVLIDMPCYAGNNNLAFNISSEVAEEVGMRFRIAPVGGLRSTGIAIGGEVEDMSIQMKIATAVEGSKTEQNSPDEFGLLHNYPNPFNPTTTIPFHLPEMAEVKITIYDILGRQVRTLVHGDWSPGSHAVMWDGITDWGYRASSGIYIYQIECKGRNGQKQLFIESHKMLLLK